jgi:hypothetical protein
MAGSLELAGAAGVCAQDAVEVPAGEGIEEAAPAPEASPEAPRVRMDETVITGTKTEHPVDEAPVPTEVVPR